MKRLYKGKLFLIATLSLLSTSCNDFGDLNTDPTKSANLDASKQLTLVQIRFSGDLEVNEKLAGVMTMPIVQQVGGIWLNRYGQMYIKSKPYLTSLWDFTYGNDVLNIIDAVERTKGNPQQSNLNAVCRIMKVYEFARMTDLYGDIPYFQAGKAYTEGIVRPEYTPQEQIYDDFFKELSEASAQLDASKDPVSGDLFYNGNIAAWKKFANSLHLRLAMRLVKVNPTKAKTEAEAAFNAGVFTSNGDICMLKHENVQNDYSDYRGNGVSVAFNQSEVVPRVCNTFIQQLRDTNDPRLKYLVKYYLDMPYKPFERTDVTEQVVAKIGYQGVAKGSYIWDDWMSGFDIEVPGKGTVTLTNNEQKAQLDNCMIRNNAPFLHLTYAEVELLLADAAFRFGVNWGGDAESHYKKGIAAAMSQLSLYPGGPVIPASEINTFIQGNGFVPGRELQAINTQLWIALLMNGPEAYANWRRSGFPALTPAHNPDSEETSIPRRFEYPLTEQEQNAANYNKAVQALGGADSWLKNVWWDKQ
ncbi:SusD/RagB family nutrient-binding outer membrane lipoprotein [Solitalea longa]|nr:SusD/RagB family nutrient-binding outer membrane lipoprotein [Solitalea longa]